MSSNLPRMVPFRTCSPLSEGLMGGRWRCWAHVLRSVQAVLSGVGAASRGLRKGAIGPRSSEDSTATLGSPAGSPGARHSVCSRKSRCVVLRISSGLRRRSRRSRLSLRESKSDVALLRPPVDWVQVAAVSRAREALAIEEVTCPIQDAFLTEARSPWTRPALLRRLPQLLSRAFTSTFNQLFSPLIVPSILQSV